MAGSTGIGSSQRLGGAATLTQVQKKATGSIVAGSGLQTVSRPNLQLFRDKN